MASLPFWPKTLVLEQFYRLQDKQSPLSTYLALDLQEGPSKPSQCMGRETQAQRAGGLEPSQA